MAVKYITCRTDESDSLGRAIHEVVLSKKMSHPNVVQCFSWTVLSEPDQDSTSGGNGGGSDGTSAASQAGRSSFLQGSSFTAGHRSGAKRSLAERLQGLDVQSRHPSSERLRRITERATMEHASEADGEGGQRQQQRHGPSPMMGVVAGAGGGGGARTTDGESGGSKLHTQGSTTPTGSPVISALRPEAVDAPLAPGSLGPVEPRAAEAAAGGGDSASSSADALAMDLAAAASSEVGQLRSFDEVIEHYRLVAEQMAAAEADAVAAAAGGEQQQEQQQERQQFSRSSSLGLKLSNTATSSFSGGRDGVGGMDGSRQQAKDWLCLCPANRPPSLPCHADVASGFLLGDSSAAEPITLSAPSSPTRSSQQPTVFHSAINSQPPSPCAPPQQSRLTQESHQSVGEIQDWFVREAQERQVAGQWQLAEQRQAGQERLQGQQEQQQEQTGEQRQVSQAWPQGEPGGASAAAEAIKPWTSEAELSQAPAQPQPEPWHTTSSQEGMPPGPELSVTQMAVLANHSARSSVGLHCSSIVSLSAWRGSSRQPSTVLPGGEASVAQRHSSVLLQPVPPLEMPGSPRFAALGLSSVPEGPSSSRLASLRGGTSPSATASSLKASVALQAASC